MSIRASIAVLVSMMVNAVVFGAGAIAVLSIPRLSAQAAYLLPLVVAMSFLISPFIAWYIAPMLRSRWQREHGTRQAAWD
jgi:uncharacterized membrane protein YciS (DUF1049 family)